MNWLRSSRCAVSAEMEMKLSRLVYGCCLVLGGSPARIPSIDRLLVGILFHCPYACSEVAS